MTLGWLGVLATSGGWSVAALGLAVSAALGFFTWLASLAYRDVSLVDRVWSLLILGAALAYWFALPERSVRAPWMLAVLALWAVRLALYVTRRNWRQPEDRRYQAIRERNQPNFEFKSLVYIFALQAALAWLVSAPLLAGFSGPNGWGALDTLGLAIAAAGTAFEAVADAQMMRFKAAPENRGKVMDQGLWRYTRHPNYFGEFCVWWGLWLMAVGAGGGAWSVVSPLVMTVLLLKVSGVSLLEADIGERRPAYRDYIARTNAFVPGPPRRRNAA